MKKLTLFALVLCALPLPAVAQEQESPLAMTVVNVTADAEAAAGTPRANAEARPTDVLRYRITFTNRTEAPVRDIVLADDIPQALQLVGGSARSSAEAQVEYSADGGASWSARPMEEVTVDGRRVMRPIPPERFTNVRWTIRESVQPRATVTAEYDTRFRPASAQ